MQSDPFQILLGAKNCSGRGVRLKDVGPDGRQDAALNAAKLAGEDATAVEYNALMNRELLKRSLVAVTEEGGIKSVKDLLAYPADGWKKYTIGELETGKLDELFTSKDSVILSSIMQQIYDASQKEVDAIMGGALPVSEG